MGDESRRGTLPRPLRDSLCHICPQLLQHMRLRLPAGARDMGFRQGQVVPAGGDTPGYWER